ncbi:MAG: cyclase family protein, partial [Candidatus Binataceae bacterium]
MKRKLVKLPAYTVLAVLCGLANVQARPSAALAQAGSQENSLAEAYRIIASKQFVDLTHSFGPLTPVWKGFGPATFSAASDPETGRPYTIEKDGFRVFFYSMVGQYGTHVDPPAHFDP